MRDEVTMTDRKPYLLRAIYQWIVDNDCTPHLVIAAPGAGWVHGVPLHLLQEGPSSRSSRGKPAKVSVCRLQKGWKRARKTATQHHLHQMAKTNRPAVI